MRVEGAVVLVEPLIQSETPVKHEGAYCGAAVVAPRSQDGGQRNGVGSQNFRIVLRAIEEGISENF